MIVYFSTKTGNTKRFVEKIKNTDSICIQPNLIINKPFVLFTATYAKNDGSGAVHPSVIKFLNNNKNNIIAVVGGGNRNFGEHFAYAADIISYKCNIPILHKFELFGNDEDVEFIEYNMSKLFNNNVMMHV